MGINFEVCRSFPIELYRRFLARYVEPHALREAGRVIDLGCGSGTVLLELRKNYRHHVTGVDIAAESIEVCRSHPELRANSVFLEADVMALTARPEMREAFDLVVSYSCLHLVPGGTREKFAVLDYLAKPGALIAIDALPNTLWNRLFFELVRRAFRSRAGRGVARVLGPWLAPNMPRDYLDDLSGITYIGSLRFENFIDLSYFRTPEFDSRFEILKKEVVPQDGFFTGRKLRFTLRKRKV